MLAAALAGCATPPVTSWTRAGASERDLTMEQAQCRNEARAIASGERVAYVAAAIADRAFADCMLGKGWTTAAK